MTRNIPVPLTLDRFPTYPGGISSLGMVHQDQRFPAPVPRDWEARSSDEHTEWTQKHLSLEEWTIARTKVTNCLVAMQSYHPFYGIIIARMAEKQLWIDTPEKLAQMERGRAGKFRTLATDGRVLYLWPQCPLYFSHFELTGLLMHELVHNLLLHPQRSRGYDPDLGNIAMDYVTNLTVNDAALLIAGKQNEKMGSAVYESLAWAMPVEPLIMDPKDPNNPETQSGWYVDEQYRNDSGHPLLFEEVYHRLQERKNCGKGCGRGILVNDHGTWQPGGRAGDDEGQTNVEITTAERMREIVLDAYVAIGEKNIGDLPGGLKRQIDKWLHPPLPWQTLLSAYMEMVPFDFHWAPGDLRFDDPMPWVHEKPDISYMVLTFDVSGSMGMKEIAACIANARAILQGFPAMKGMVIIWDAQVGQVFPIEDFEGEIDRGLCGGGGTRIAPQFEMVKELGIEGQVSVLASFTDGMVPWGEVDPNKIPYPVLWVITNDREDTKPPDHPTYRFTRLEVEGY